MPLCLCAWLAPMIILLSLASKAFFCRLLNEFLFLCPLAPSLSLFFFLAWYVVHQIPYNKQTSQHNDYSICPSSGAPHIWLLLPSLLLLWGGPLAGLLPLKWPVLLAVKFFAWSSFAEVGRSPVVVPLPSNFGLALPPKPLPLGPFGLHGTCSPRIFDLGALYDIFWVLLCSLFGVNLDPSHLVAKLRHSHVSKLSRRALYPANC